MTFEEMLTGGHPNSLGRTEEVVEIVLGQHARFGELLDTYRSADEVVRLRVSSAIKRVAKAQPDLVFGSIEVLLGEVAEIDQPSTKWTLAQLFALFSARLSADQKTRATQILKNNLETCDDWIVQNMTMETLTDWAQSNRELEDWLIPRLQQRTTDSRKSVAKRAQKFHRQLVG